MWTGQHLESLKLKLFADISKTDILYVLTGVMTFVLRGSTTGHRTPHKNEMIFN